MSVHSTLNDGSSCLPTNEDKIRAEKRLSTVANRGRPPTVVI
jgi:hypothetical protein